MDCLLLSAAPRPMIRPMLVTIAAVPPKLIHAGLIVITVVSQGQSKFSLLCATLRAPRSMGLTCVKRRAPAFAIVS
jgi:hypothetical protein